MRAGKTQTRRQRLEQKEHAIVAAARKMFLKHGFDGAKIAEIAKLAGVAEGTVYLYFENKNALLVAVLRAFYDVLTQDAVHGVEKFADTGARLEFLARHHLESVAREWQILTLATQQHCFSDDYKLTETYQFNRIYVAVFDQVIRDGINRGDIRDDVPLSLMRDIFYGGLEYAGRTARLRTKKVEQVSGQVVRDFLRILTTGVTPPTGARQRTDNAEPLSAIATRLERVTSRLEQTASVATPKMGSTSQR